MTMAFHTIDHDAGSEQQLDQVRALMSPTEVDHQIRQAIHFLWICLPKEKRNVEEVERQIRRLVERALRDLREDYQALFSKG